MEYVGEETIVEEDSGEGGWVETHTYDDTTVNANGRAVEEKLSEMTLDTPSSEAAAVMEDIHDNIRNEAHCGDEADDDDDDDEGEACDMEDFIESGMLETVDPAIAIRPPKPEPPAASTQNVDEDTASVVVKTRTYDLHITYDKYYQTPRLWIVGYDEVGYCLCV